MWTYVGSYVTLLVGYNVICPTRWAAAKDDYNLYLPDLTSPCARADYYILTPTPPRVPYRGPYGPPYSCFT